MSSDHDQQPIDPSASDGGPTPADPVTSPSSPPQGRPPSRTAAWLGMGAVAVTLGLLWMVPSLDDHSDEQAAFEAGAGTGDSRTRLTSAAGGDGSAVGNSARLDFTLKDMNGVEVKLASFRGKVILLNFWATWCGPCKVEIPDLVALQEQYRDDLVVLGVLVQDDMDEKIPAFASEFRINYPLLDGNNRTDVETAYGPFWGIPSSVIIGRDGRIAVKHSGILSREQFDRELTPLVASTAESS